MIHFSSFSVVCIKQRLLIAFGVAVDKVKKMYNLICILKPRVHPKATRRRIRMRCISHQKNIFMPHFICQKGLKFPFSYMDYIDIPLNIFPVLRLEHRGDQLSRRIHFGQIDEWLVVGHLEYKCASLV